MITASRPAMPSRPLRSEDIARVARSLIADYGEAAGKRAMAKAEAGRTAGLNGTATIWRQVHEAIKVIRE